MSANLFVEDWRLSYTGRQKSIEAIGEEDGHTDMVHDSMTTQRLPLIELKPNRAAEVNIIETTLHKRE